MSHEHCFVAVKEELKNIVPLSFELTTSSNLPTNEASMTSFANSTSTPTPLKKALELVCEEASLSTTITKCGKLICQVNSELIEYNDGHIVSIVEVESDKKDTSNSINYVLSLTETIFFPKGGGKKKRTAINRRTNLYSLRN